MCVCVFVVSCRVHAGVVLLSGSLGLFSTTFDMLLRCLWLGRGGGWTALSLFLAHYIIIINIIAVLLLVLQLFSF